jgi:hypothetical protein
MGMTNTEILDETAKLVDAWCDRRCLHALGFILQGFPLHCPHTDGWGDLLVGLRNVHQYARKDITEAELETVNKLIAEMKSWNW